MDTAGKRPIVLLTDFGQTDIFAGVLKGVIASISPETKVMDLTHGITPRDIFKASFLLAASYSYFPKGSVFCVIVDPGVGSDRKAICIETRDYIFIGPDNGVLLRAAAANHIKRMVHLTNFVYFLEPVSSTFHGRDIFAPVAAHISKGLEDLSVLGNPLEKSVECDFPKVKKNRMALELTVIHIDRFGNATLNLEEKAFLQFVRDRQFCLTIGDARIRKVCTCYSQAGDGAFFLICASSAHMEISLKNASASELLGIECGDKAVLEILDK